MAAALSPVLALRIGLAARALPEASAGTLMRVLVETLGLPLTDQKLKRITIGQLRSAAGGLLGPLPRSVLKAALAYLHDRAGVDVIDPDVPAVDSHVPGDLPGSVRIAVASDHGSALDGNFSSCARFLVYQVNATAARLIDVRGTAAGKASRDPLAWRVALVRDCPLVCVMSANVPAMAALMKASLYPVKYPMSGTAAEAIETIQQVLRDTPPPWLGKLIGMEALERWHCPRLFALT